MKDINPDSVLNGILTQWPNLNLFSIYSTIYIPFSGLSHTYHVRASNLTDPYDII